jgi:hypothetical protein
MSASEEEQVSSEADSDSSEEHESSSEENDDASSSEESSSASEQEENGGEIEQGDMDLDRVAEAPAWGGITCNLALLRYVSSPVLALCRNSISFIFS